ncbi:unnamed protein product [Symbiodinium natans]|uniref:Uncharacterized protein n=1 Tax=Symbiodinium natans TaxID=878477 RepID=A0A812M478_9DINO|nr:unnamed protein product [Symbiodinium natans]
MPLCRLKHWTAESTTAAVPCASAVEAAKDMGEDHHLPVHTTHTAVAEPAPAVPGESAKAVLIATCVLVDAMAPLLQEQASKSFPGYFMVLAETVTYFFGGLSLAIMQEGVTGMRRCFRPWRYLSFMPASLAFSWAGFLTYPAIKGFGASQFYLLAQLRVAIIAVFMRIASQIQQPVTVWISLLQLVLGMVVLVWYKAGAVAGEVGCHFLPAEALKAGAAPAGSPPAEDVEVETDHMSFVISFAAMLGVIVTSAFGTLYLERQLKSSKKDPLFIQLHQLNAVGLTGALLVTMQSLHKVHSTPEEEVLGGSMIPDLEDISSPSKFLPLRVVLSVGCVVARGVLNGSVLKQLDALTKGLIDVTAIVLCTLIQVVAQGRQTDATAMGLQMLMLLSVLGFVTGRQTAAATVRPEDRPSSTLWPKPRLWPWEIRIQPIPKAL